MDIIITHRRPYEEIHEYYDRIRGDFSQFKSNCMFSLKSKKDMSGLIIQATLVKTHPSFEKDLSSIQNRYTDIHIKYNETFPILIEN